MVSVSHEKKQDRMVAIKKLLNEGLDSKAISKETGLSDRAVRKYRQELKMTFDKKSTLERLEEVREKSLTDLEEIKDWLMEKKDKVSDGCGMQYAREAVNAIRAMRDLFPQQVHEFEEDNTISFKEEEGELKEKCPHCFHRHDNHNECPEKRKDEVIEE